MIPPMPDWRSVLLNFIYGENTVRGSLCALFIMIQLALILMGRHSPDHSVGSTQILAQGIISLPICPPLPGLRGQH